MISALRLTVSDIVLGTFPRTGAACEAGQVEHALGEDLAAVNLSQGNQAARCRDIDRTAEYRSIPSAQQNGLATLEPGRIGPADSQRRDVVQRGFNGHERVDKVALAGGGSMPQSLQLFQTNHAGFT